VADLTPAELAKLDQIHSAVMDRLTALVSSAVDGIRTEGEPFTASTLAGQAQATDHTSVSTLFAAALIRLARHQIAAEKRQLRAFDEFDEPVKTEDGYESEHYTAAGLDQSFSYSGSPDRMAEHAIAYTTRHHTDPAYADDPYVYSRVIRYTDRTYRTVDEVVFELGTKPEATP
jgi:hypothetical protein